MRIKKRLERLGDKLLDSPFGFFWIFGAMALILLPIFGWIGYNTMEYTIEYWTDYEISLGLLEVVAGVIGVKVWIPAAIITVILS